MENAIVEREGCPCGDTIQRAEDDRDDVRILGVEQRVEQRPRVAQPLRDLAKKADDWRVCCGDSATDEMRQSGKRASNAGSAN